MCLGEFGREAGDADIVGKKVEVRDTVEGCLFGRELFEGRLLS